MKRAQIARLRDMLDAIDAVAEMIEGTDFAGYQHDGYAQDGARMTVAHSPAAATATSTAGSPFTTPGWSTAGS